MDTIKLYFRSMGMLLKSQLQYPASFFMQTLAQLVMEGGEMLAVILIVDRFGQLGHWMPGDLFFFFGMMSVTFYMTEIFGRGVTGNFPSLVRTGQLDTLLLRPRGVLTQVLCSAIDPRRITCIAVGVTALIIGSNMSQVQWTVLKALALAESLVVFLLAAPLMRAFISNAEIVADGAVMLRWQISGMVFSAVVLLYTCLFQASGKALQALAMSLSRQGVLFVAVFVIAVAVGGYRGFLAAQPIADALSAALALALYRGAFGRRA